MPVSYDLGTAAGKVVIDFDDTGTKKATKGLDTVSDSAKNLTKSTRDVQPLLKSTSTSALVAGTVIAGGFALAVKSATDFQFQLSAIQAVSGATASEMDKINDAALRIGKDTAFSASEAGKAMEELLKSGISVSDTLNGAADATVALAAAGQIDLPLAASISAAAMNQFKIAATDLTSVADLLAGAANASATGVAEIGQALSFVGPVSAAAGLSIEDTATAIAILANNGIDGMKAGTGLRAILSQLQPSSKQAAEAMKELGLITEDGTSAFYNADGSLKDLRDIVQILGGAFGDLTEQQKIAYGTTIFGRDSLAAINAVAATSTEEFDKLTTAISGVSAADVAAQRLNNMQGQLEQMRGSLETAAIMIGQMLIPALTDMVKSLVSALDWFVSLDDGTRKWIVRIAGGLGAALLLAGAVGKIALGAMELRRNVLLATGATTLWTAATTGSSVATMAAAAATRIWAVAMKALPIIAIIALVAGLIAAIVEMNGGWGEIVKLAKPILDSLVAAFSPLLPIVKELGDAIANVFGAALEALMPILQVLSDTIFPILVEVIKALTPIITVVAKILAAILGPAMQLLGVLIKALTPIIVTLISALEPLIDLLMMVLKPVLDVIVWALGLLGDGLTWLVGVVTDFFTGTNGEVSDAQNVWGDFAAFIAAVWDGIVKMFDDVVGSIVGFFTGLWDGITGIWQSVADFFTGVINTIAGVFQWWMGVVQTVMTAIISFVQPIVNWFMQHVAPVFTAFGNLVAKVFNYLGSVIAFVWNSIVAAIQGAIDWLVGVMTPIIQFVVAAVVGYFTTLWNAVTTVWQAIVDAISTAVNAVVSVITTVWGLIIGFVTPIFQAIWSFVSGIFQRIYDFIAGIVKSVVSFITSVWNGLIGIVSTIFTNVYNAIKKPIDDVLGVFKDMYDNIIDFFSDAGEWLLSIGGDIIGGLIKGIEGALGWLTDVLNGITNMIPDEKGPPAKDKILLQDSGSLIMQGLINGIREEVPELMGLLGAITLGIPSDMQANINAAMPTTGDSRTFNYNAAPGGAQLSGEDELFVAMKRSKVVVPGWA